MSDPTRYRVANNQAQLTLGGNILAVDPAGPLVMYDDYARLKAECQARQAENSVLAVECDSLKAEVERLTERNQHLEQIDSYLQSANLNAEEQRSIELEAENDRLKAEVERLTNLKSGADFFKAKEGKQS